MGAFVRAIATVFLWTAAAYATSCVRDDVCVSSGAQCICDDGHGGVGENCPPIPYLDPVRLRAANLLAPHDGFVPTHTVCREGRIKTGEGNQTRESCGRDSDCRDQNCGGDGRCDNCLREGQSSDRAIFGDDGIACFKCCSKASATDQPWGKCLTDPGWMVWCCGGITDHPSCTIDFAQRHPADSWQGLAVRVMLWLPQCCQSPRGAPACAVRAALALLFASALWYALTGRARETLYRVRRIE